MNPFGPVLDMQKELDAEAKKLGRIAAMASMSGRRAAVVGIGGLGRNVVWGFRGMAIKGIRLVMVDSQHLWSGPAAKHFDGIMIDDRVVGVKLVEPGSAIGGAAPLGQGRLAGERSAIATRGLIHRALKGATMVLVVADLEQSEAGGAAAEVTRIAKRWGATVNAMVI